MKAQAVFYRRFRATRFWLSPLLALSLVMAACIIGFGQPEQNGSYLIELSSPQNLGAAKLEILNEDPPGNSIMYRANVRDKLGESFQTEENLHVRIGDRELKYHIGPEKKSIMLEFGTDHAGYYPYKIYGRFKHLDGSWYQVSGSGQVYVKGGELFDLYLLSLDKRTKMAIAFIQ